MSSCEKCWRDSATGPFGDHAEAYRLLLKQRDAEGKTCTPEEQAGPDAGTCRCGRKTLHQHTGQPMCGCSKETP